MYILLILKYCNDFANDQRNITGGDDYKSGPYNVTFTAGMNTSSFTVPITDDDVFEDIEYFTLKINSVLPSSIDIGDPRQATVAIEDNEGT